MGPCTYRGFRASARRQWRIYA